MCKLQGRDPNMGLKAIDKGLVAGRNKEKQKGKEEEEGEETEKDGD